MRAQSYNKKMNQQNFTGFFSNKYMFIQRARLFSLLLPVTCYPRHSSQYFTTPTYCFLYFL